MEEDPYAILGVAKSASETEISKAYRELAKKLHPDLNPGDKSAEERFKKVSGAYALLGDPENRARFDRGEIDASGAEHPEHGFYRHYAEAEGGNRYHSAAGFEDLKHFSDLFSGLYRQGDQAAHTVRIRGRDLRYRLDVDFLQAVNGSKKRVTMPDGKVLDVSIPAGTRDGGVLRLRGKGGPGIGDAPPGDALVDIHVRPHPLFIREKDDILIDLPLTLDEAVLGARVDVPTIAGKVKMTVPKGASSGQTFRLKGRGVSRRGNKGDQRVTLKIVLPNEIDKDLEDFITDWRNNHSYNPRESLWSQT